MIPFGVKMCGESEFDIYKIPWIQEKLYIDVKIRENHLFALVCHEKKKSKGTCTNFKLKLVAIL
jgi:hypothetical protein